MMFGWSCRNGSDSFEFLGLKKMFHSVLHMFQKAQTRKGEETYLVQLTSQRRNMFWRRCSKDSLNSSSLSIIDSVIQWLSPSSSWWQSLAWSARGFSSSPATNQHSCRVVRQTNSNFQQFGWALVREQTWCGRSFTRLGNRLYCSNGVGGLVLSLADIAIGPRLLCIPPASATMLTPMSKENNQVQHSQEYLFCLIKASGFTMWMTSSTQK